jgi:hypothetical protein
VARDAAESRMELLMRDFKGVVEELAGIASNQSSAGAPLDDRSVHTADVSATAKLPPPPARKGSTPRGRVAGGSSSALSGGGSVSKAGWSAMQAQMNDICGRWANARRDAKAAVFGCVSVHPSSVGYLRGGEASAGRDAKKHKGKRDGGAFGGSEMSTASDTRFASCAADAYGDMPSDPVQFVQLGGLWGSAASPHYVAGRAEGSGSGGSAMELNLSRVHALQRELVEFSKMAFQTTHQWHWQHQCMSQSRVGSVASDRGDYTDTRVPEDMSMSFFADTGKPGASVSRLDLLGSQVRTENSMAELRAISRDLLLQCSSLAPLAPLTSQLSASTGLEQFIKEASSPPFTHHTVSLSNIVAADLRCALQQEADVSPAPARS